MKTKNRMGILCIILAALCFSGCGNRVKEKTEIEITEQAEFNPEDGPAQLAFSDLYAEGSSRGLVFSDKLQALDGYKVTMTGYMAPPLKPSLDFFVLTMQPMSICPFCDSDASWPANIVLIYMQDGKTAESTTNVLEVTGRLEIGSYTDEVTGFVSQIRIFADEIKELK